jgi:hypothetical protein
MPILSWNLHITLMIALIKSFLKVSGLIPVGAEQA